MRRSVASCLVIDDDTTVRSFEQELRWNDAYHRLAH
jgi:L-arabinose isomerase